jgi:hypothetical protein
MNKIKKRTKSNRYGLTAVELITSIAIVAILGVVTIAGLSNCVGNGDAAEDDWILPAAIRLSDALDDPNVSKDPEVRKAMTEKLDLYETIAEDREQAHILSSQFGPTPGELPEISRARRTKERIVRAHAKDEFRQLNPEQRKVWRNFPGMAEIAQEVDAESIPNSGRNYTR